MTKKNKLFTTIITFTALFRLLLENRLIILPSVLLLTISNSIYALSGLYALIHAKNNLIILDESSKSTDKTVFIGFSLLFTSQLIINLYHQLSITHIIDIMPSFIMATHTSLFIQVLASALPIIAFSCITTLCFYRLCTSNRKDASSIYTKIAKAFDITLLLVSTLLCCTQGYLSIASLLNKSTLHLVNTPYSALYFSNLLKPIFNTVGTIVLLLPRFTSSQEIRTPIEVSHSSTPKKPTKDPIGNLTNTHINP